ncbi:MAG: hypothetical protein LAP13_09395, partial [Acidobacteriia bacterium]|nr:hypothetical protein [Terriglobia bacterium]
MLLVFLFGFFVLGLLAYRTYRDEPPIPSKVVDLSGNVLFTHDAIIAGQEVFLRNGLMEYGSIFGHGAYLGPDYTADYLHRAALLVMDAYGGESSDRARAQTIADFKTNRYDASSDKLTFSAAQTHAFQQLVGYYQEFFSRSFLLESGDPIGRHSVRGFGELLPISIPFAILGAVVILVRRDRASKLALWWLACYPVAPSLMTE